MGGKAQVSTEFIILIALAFLTMMGMIVASGRQAFDAREQREFIKLKDVVYKNHDEILIASESNLGYMRTYENPDNLSGTSYNLTIIQTELIGYSENYEFSLIIPEIAGDMKKGENNISNLNGTVCLNC